MNDLRFHPLYAGAINYLLHGGRNLDEAVATLQDYATKALYIPDGTQKEIGTKIQQNFRAFIEWNKIYQKEKKLQRNNPFKVKEYV